MAMLQQAVENIRHDPHRLGTGATYASADFFFSIVRSNNPGRHAGSQFRRTVGVMSHFASINLRTCVNDFPFASLTLSR
jgi:hypothetical protein